MEKPKMSLSEFRGHCEKVQAQPIMHLIDRVMHLSIMAEAIIAHSTCICKDEKNLGKQCNHCLAKMYVDKHGYLVPLP
jgi:hypothetical protein